MRVTVILDRAYGARDHHPLGSAFWLIESPENRSLAERVWSAGNSDPNSAVFKGDGFASMDDAAISTFFNVVEHHPLWTEIEFIGVRLSASIREELVGDGSVLVMETEDGFLVTRANT